MNKKQIQRMRIVVQLIFIIFFTEIFALYFNSFKISYLSNFDKGNPINIYSTSFILIIAISLLVLFLGRFFCEWLCAFGTLNDFMYMIGQKILKKQYKMNKKSDTLLKYLKYCIVIIIVSFSWTVNKLEFNDYSPWNAFANISNIYEAFFEIPVGFIIVTLILIVAMFIERFFCRYLCPLGALQVLISNIKLAEIRKNTSLCGKCSICTHNCTMKIDLNQKERIRSSECIGCLKCISNCPKENASKMVLKRKIKPLSYMFIGLIIFFVPYYMGETISEKTIYNEHITQKYDQVKDQGYIINQNEDDSERILKDKNKKYNDGVYTGVLKSIEVSITIKNDNILDVQIISHKEDSGFYEEPFDQIPKQVINLQTLNVDVVSGATNTSERLINAIGDALEKARKTL